MTMKRDGRGRMRDYKKEYDRDHSSKDDKKDRASRNAARKKLKDFYESRGRKLAKNKDVDHKDGNPRNNKAGNLRTMDKGKNRGRSNKYRTKNS